MSVKAIERKVQEVEAIKQQIEESCATVAFHYEGLSVAQVSELRDLLRKEEIEMKVLKNNISTRAFKAANFDEMDGIFKGPTAVAFSKNDVTAAARILHDFSKKNKQLELLAGTMEDSFASKEQVQELATLPNKEGMLSMLLSVLQAPIRGLAQVTQQVADQKEEN